MSCSYGFRFLSQHIGVQQVSCQSLISNFMSAGRSTELHVTILSPATAKLVYEDDFMVDDPILDPPPPEFDKSGGPT